LPQAASPRPLRAAIYARVSKLDQNPDLQFRELRQYIERRGWTAKEFVDHGISGAETKRPQLADLKQRLYKREFDALVVWKFDRVFRSVTNMVELCEFLRHLNVQFISLTEQIDTETPQGKLVFHVLAAIAEFERDLIRERIMAGLEAARARGVAFGRPKKIVNRQAILRDRAMGLSYQKIAKKYGLGKATVFELCQGGRKDRRREKPIEEGR